MPSYITLKDEKAGVSVNAFCVNLKAAVNYVPPAPNRYLTYYIPVTAFAGANYSANDPYYKSYKMANSAGNYIEKVKNTQSNAAFFLVDGTKINPQFSYTSEPPDYNGYLTGSLNKASLIIFFYDDKKTYQGQISGYYDDYETGGVKYGPCYQVGVRTDEATLSWFTDISPESDYKGPISTSGGGKGTFDIKSDAIDFPPPLALSATNSGFVSLFVPTIAQIQQVSAYIWSDAFDLTNIKKIFSDVADVIIGLTILPFTVPAPQAKELNVAGIPTGITLNVAISQFFDIDFGVIDVLEYWGGAFDYAPYTKTSIYLPYIGTRELDTDDVMGKKIQLVYRVDVMTGACVAMIKCGDAVLYSFGGEMATPVPINSTNFSEFLKTGVMLATAGIVAAGTGGAGIAAGAGALGMGMGAGVAGMTARATTAAAASQSASTVSNLAGAAALNVANCKPVIQKSGVVAGAAGFMGVQTPYLLRQLPRQSLPQNYNKYCGYPSNITAKLSDLKGYTVVESIRLDGLTASADELQALEMLLKSGVIL